MSEPEFYEVKNWKRFQHYNDRNPAWIKLHRSLLSDYEFAKLGDSQKAHIILIWLFASTASGRIPNDPIFLKEKLSLKRCPKLGAFAAVGLLIPCANSIQSQTKVGTLDRVCAQIQHAFDTDNGTGKGLAIENASTLLSIDREEKRQRREGGGE